MNDLNTDNQNNGLIRVGIIGGAGYTGGELIRLLLNHPKVEISFIQSKSNSGRFVHEVHPDLVGDTDLKFSGVNDQLAGFTHYADVLFLCVGHGEAKKFIDGFAYTAVSGSPFKGVKIIDLSQDYRLKVDGGRPDFLGESVIYGLPELNKPAIQSASFIANPGCFATCIQLGLLPLAGAGLLSNIYTTGITGSTGAGQGLSQTSHFSWRANNIQAYKSLEHQHIKEITESLRQLQRTFSNALADDDGLHFVPWRGDFTRGIYVSSTLECNKSVDEIYKLYHEFYDAQPFTHVSEKMIDLKQVVNTNKCLVHVEKVRNKVVVHSAMDNLLKGASGQAVQNMNLLFGFDETTGLKLKANAF